MIPFLDKTIVKLTLALTIITTIGFGLKFTYDAIYESGADSVRAELEKQYTERETMLNKKLDEAIKKNESNRNLALKLEKKFRLIQIENRTVLNEINNTVYECDNLGDEFNRLWNKAIGEQPKLD